MSGAESEECCNFRVRELVNYIPHVPGNVVN